MSTHSLMFGWEYPPLHLGGLGVACQGLVRGLLHHEVKVTLVLPYESETDDVEVRFPTDEIVQQLRICSMLQPYSTQESFEANIRKVPKIKKDIYGNDLGEAISNYTEMSVKMTEDLDPDIVHCHDWMTYEAGRRAAQHHNVPMVAHIHATELDRTSNAPNEYIYNRERLGFEAADKIIAVSNYTKNVLVSQYGITPEKIVVVHNGSFDLGPSAELIESKRQQHTDNPMVLFLGRLVTQKGAVQFLEMAAAVHQIRPEVQFVIAGDGHMLEELVDVSLQFGLQDSVIFAGKVGSMEVKQLYTQADCFVMPSVSEPFGLVALEAISHGTPVILSRQSGAAEVIDDCFQVDFWDTAKMADCVLTILREEALAHQLRSYAPRILGKLTWQRQASIVNSLYQDLIYC
ncbi:MAG: glycosyltransferase family 4 protein [bacterium]|nr:glycosyltransferase family 4 protein [bacterium]